ncbi:hypothetical protein [uncultured Aeromicrobium sp.]|uniref:hypothetical protein n=1 Tax=uncultured Aeromicrobium sp. TaxID=337820 RepID=UPI0025F25A02|nr:hypothetical protein [uncultured Aeromicrobium sp.]
MNRSSPTTIALTAAISGVVFGIFLFTLGRLGLVAEFRSGWAVLVATVIFAIGLGVTFLVLARRRR